MYFSKKRESKAVCNFSENYSVLVEWGFPILKESSESLNRKVRKEFFEIEIININRILLVVFLFPLLYKNGHQAQGKKFDCISILGKLSNLRNRF